MALRLELQKVEEQIRQISKYLNLTYNPKWFAYLFIPREAHELIEYYGTCPDPDYQKFGRNPKKRLANINKFIDSKEFKQHLKRWGGQVYSKTGYKSDLKAFINIKNKELKNVVFKTLAKVNKKLTRSDSIILLTEPKSKRELQQIMRFILRHELTHILLEKNNINFQSKGKNRYWKYDEGLVTYLDYWVENRLGSLEREVPKYKNLMEKWYFIFAIKFRELLENKGNSIERKKAILKIIKQKQ
jgi:hypothetical protein